MAELKTRISLKYDTLENWQKSTLKLNKGELAIAVIPTADPAKKQLPPVMFKVGDGEHTFAELGDNWASALAADVYSWAKAATRPAYKYGDADLTGFGTAAEKNVGDFDASGAAATAEQNAKNYVDEKIAAIPAQAEFTLETGETDGSLVLKKNGVAVGDDAVVKGWAELLAKAQQGIDDAATAKAAAEAAQNTANSKYSLPEGGIPKTDLADAVQTSLGKADTALQSHQTVTLEGGTDNGTLKLTVGGVETDNIAVTGLGTAAYKADTAFDAAGTAANAVNQHNTSDTAHADIRGTITALAEKVSGRATAYVYKNKNDAAYTTAIGKAGSFVIGDTIYFTDSDIPDEWVTAVSDSAPYYTFQEIETEKPSFDGYVKGTDLTADKIIVGSGNSNVETSSVGIVTTLTAGDNSNVPSSGAVSTYVGNQISGKQDKIKAGEHITIGSDGVTVNAAWPTASDAGYEGIGKVGTVTGVKMNGADKTVGSDGIVDLGTVITDISGKQDSLTTDQLAAVNSGITEDKVKQYDGYATGKQDTLSATNKLPAAYVDGLGTAAAKDIAETITAAGVNLPTEKAVADYVSTEIGKIDIPTVNNAALKDASGATIFTANASADVEITIIDCGNASGWEA